MTAEKIQFGEFKRLVDDGEMPLDILSNYLEQDPEVSVPKLRFKAGALIDEPPKEYEIDDEIYRMLRKREEAERMQKVEIFGFRENPKVVAEGDSWFRFPPFPLFPIAIADWIKRNPNMDIVNIAHWGYTLSDILSKKEYMRTIHRDDTEYFMLSAGGNDLQRRIPAYIHDYDPQRPLKDYLTQDGRNDLTRIGAGYNDLLAEVSDRFPKVRILCYGYDYPRPTHFPEIFIGRYLAEKGIPKNKMQGVINPAINELNEIIKGCVSDFPMAKYINCLNATAGL